MGDKIVASKDIMSRATTTFNLSGCLLFVLLQRGLSRAWSRRNESSVLGLGMVQTSREGCEGRSGVMILVSELTFRIGFASWD